MKLVYNLIIESDIINLHVRFKQKTAQYFEI